MRRNASIVARMQALACITQLAIALSVQPSLVVAIEGTLIPDAGVSAQIEGRGWRLELELLDTLTVPYQDVWTLVTLTNISGAPQPRLSLREGDNLEIDLLDANRDRLSQCKTYVFRLPFPPDTVRQSETRSTYRNLRALLCDSAALSSFAPGLYSASVSLYLDAEFRLPREGNTLDLESVEFRVLAPTGREAEALALYRTAINNIRDNPNRAREALYRILSEYSDTRYDAVANQCFLLCYETIIRPYGGSEELLALQKRFFVRHPESAVNPTLNIPKLVHALSREEMQALYRQIHGRPEARVTTEFLQRTHPWVIQAGLK